MKTTWQKIYSFFGFWTYETVIMDFSNKMNGEFKSSRTRTLYWCCFPFWYFRKFDLYTWKI